MKKHTPVIKTAGGIRIRGPYLSDSLPMNGVITAPDHVPALTARASDRRSQPVSSVMRLWTPPSVTCATPVAT